MVHAISTNGGVANEPRLTKGLRQTFVPPLDGRDSAAQPERYPS